MSTDTLPAPVAVWDPNNRHGGFRRHIREASAWAVEHFPDANSTVLAEFYLIDAPFAVVHMARRNENGRLYNDPGTGQLAMQEPLTVMLSELPPARLLRHSERQDG